MQRQSILITTPMHHSVIAGIQEHFVLYPLLDQIDLDALFEEHGRAIQGIATSSFYGTVDDSIFSRLPALEIVSNFGVGYDNIDVEAAAARGIVVTNTPGVLDDEVADFAIGLLLGTIRRIPQAEKFLREGRWSRGPFPLSPTLRGRQVGILGLGGIGKAIARRLEGFGISIAYHGRSQQPAVPYTWYATPLALAEACDTLIAILPGGPATQNIVDHDVLEALGPNGIFINVARGSIVEEQVLISALREGTILAAGLDVYAHEPNVPAEMLELPNVVLLPHIASASEHARSAMGQLVANNLVSWFRTGHALTPVPETQFAS